MRAAVIGGVAARRRGLWLGLAALAAGAMGPACGDKTTATMLAVEIHTDLMVTGQMDEVRLLVLRPGQTTPRELRFALTATAKQPPLVAGLIPASGGENEMVTLTAQGWKTNGKVVETHAIVMFKAGKHELIRMYLVAACIGDRCMNPGQTCSAGGACIMRSQPTVPFLPPDAGTPDVPPGVDAPPGSDGPVVPDAPIGIDAPDAPIGDDAGNCTCPDDGNPCTQDFCMGGTCRHPPLGDRIGCPGGLCIGGACCTGCIDGQGMCRPGLTAVSCGTGARDCMVCNDGDVCTQDRCEMGACRTLPLSGTTCPTGVCVDGRCQCGGQGQVCCANGTCSGGLACQNNTCGQCGAEGQSCCSSSGPGGTCGPGLLCTSGQCRKCGELGQPCCADGSCRSGVCGGNSGDRACQPCGAMGQACCPTGDACQANLACAGGTCVCGGQGQPCCGGSTCASDNNLCNGDEVCMNGTCGRGPPVSCPPPSQCHQMGTCDPTNGRCNPVLRPENSPCNDGNACTVGDACRAGLCTPSSVPVMCNDNRPCTEDACDPIRGCVFTPSPKGKSCVPPGPAAQCRGDQCDDNGTCVAMAANEGLTCTLPNGQRGACMGGACCPPPPQLCPVPF